MDDTALEQALFKATELLSQGQVDEALTLMATLEDEAATPRQQAQVWSRYATLFAMLEMTEEAQGAVVRALAFDEDNPRANYLDAVMLMVDQAWERAIRRLHRAAALYPASDKGHLAEVYGNLGYCHHMLDDEDRAEMYWSMAEELDPDGAAGTDLDESSPSAPPPGCGALERVEALLKQVGALKEGETLFSEPEPLPDVPEDEDEGGGDDDYWRIHGDDEDEAPAPAKAAQATPAKAAKKPSTRPRGAVGGRGGRKR